MPPKNPPTDHRREYKRRHQITARARAQLEATGLASVRVKQEADAQAVAAALPGISHITPIMRKEKVTGWRLTIIEEQSELGETQDGNE